MPRTVCVTMKLALLVVCALVCGVLCQDDGARSDMRSEKISDAALTTQDAVGKATSRGGIQRATRLGSLLGGAAAAPSASHNDIHDLDEDLGRRLLGATGLQDGGNAHRAVGDVIDESISDAALSTQEAILKASTSRGSVSKATTVGRMTATGASHLGHWQQHIAGGGRRLAQDSLNMAEEHIAKAVATPSAGSVRSATKKGSQSASAGALRWFRLEHGGEEPGRRLAEAPRRLLPAL